MREIGGRVKINGKNLETHNTDQTMAKQGKSWIVWAAHGPFTVAVLLVMSESIVEAAPTCGQHEYLENRQCLPCPTCPPGYGVSGHCGFGQGALTTCSPCDPNPADPLTTWPTYSDATNQDRCQPCKLCDNSHYSVNCSATTNSHCGPCLFGFYRTHPDEENCLPCKYVITPYAHLCQDWLDAQKTTTPTITDPPMDVSTEPFITTKSIMVHVVTPDRDALAFSSESNDSNGYEKIPIISIAILVGIGVFTFIAHKCGFLPCRQRTNPSQGPSASTVDNAGSGDPAEHNDGHGTDDHEAEQQMDNELINVGEIQTGEEEGEETAALLSSRTERPNISTPGAPGLDKDEDLDGSENDSQKGNSSSSASSTSSLDTENGDEAATTTQGDANDCSDPSSGTELLKDQRRRKSSNRRASYGSHSQKSRLSFQLSPSSSSSDSSINGNVEGGASPFKQNNAIPCRAASPGAMAIHPSVVKWSAQGGTAEVLLGETLLPNSQHQNAVGTSNQDVHKGSRPVVELPDGRLVNQTARLQSEPSTELYKKAEKTQMTGEIQKQYDMARDKFGDQGIEELSQDARDELATYLNPPPGTEGAYSNWVNLATDRFKVESAKAQNLQGMGNLLQFLQTKSNCTIRELLENVAAIERFDALGAVCRSLLKDSKHSVQHTSV